MGSVTREAEAITPPRGKDAVELLLAAVRFVGR